MSKKKHYLCAHGCLVLTFLLLSTTRVTAQDSTLELKLSSGGSWQSSNDVQIPNDSEGTRFSLNDIAGEGPWTTLRLETLWNFSEKHGIRVLLAPLSYGENGSISEPINFAGGTFTPGQAVLGEYTFNSWRLGYRYHWVQRDRWDMWVGGTLKIRDAEIKLTQGAISRADDDLGFVPLLYIAAEYRFTPSWFLATDVDALAGGPGRAIDLGVSINYNAGDKFSIGAEYRVLEGGADTDDIYNFAWFNSALLSVKYKL